MPSLAHRGGAELDVLATLVEAYERETFRMDPGEQPEPIGGGDWASRGVVKK